MVDIDKIESTLSDPTEPVDYDSWGLLGIMCLPLSPVLEEQAMDLIGGGERSMGHSSRQRRFFPQKENDWEYRRPIDDAREAPPLNYSGIRYVRIRFVQIKQKMWLK